MLTDAEVFALVVGLTQVLKEAGKLEGSLAKLLGIGVGLIVGTTFKASQAMPADLSGWFQAVVYGLTQGLTAVGLYAVVSKQIAAAKPQ